MIRKILFEFIRIKGETEVDFLSFGFRKTFWNEISCFAVTLSRFGLGQVVTILQWIQVLLIFEKFIRPLMVVEHVFLLSCSVLRVELSDREASKRLDERLENLVEFWSHLPGRHADVMVSPDTKVSCGWRKIWLKVF